MTERSHLIHPSPFILYPYLPIIPLPTDPRVLSQPSTLPFGITASLIMPSPQLYLGSFVPHPGQEGNVADREVHVHLHACMHASPVGPESRQTKLSSG
jgi:hypothetical protein